MRTGGPHAELTVGLQSSRRTFCTELGWSCRWASFLGLLQQPLPHICLLSYGHEHTADHRPQKGEQNGCRQEARMASVESSTRPARRRLIRTVRPTTTRHEHPSRDVPDPSEHCFGDIGSCPWFYHWRCSRHSRMASGVLSSSCGLPLF